MDQSGGGGTPFSVRRGHEAYAPGAVRSQALEAQNQQLEKDKAELQNQLANLQAALDDSEQALLKAQRAFQNAQADTLRRLDDLEKWAHEKEKASAQVHHAPAPVFPAAPAAHEHATARPHVLKAHELPKFSGNSRESTLWLRKMESLFSTNQITVDGQKLAYLIHALEGKAGQWFDSELTIGRFKPESEGEDGTWEGFRAAFLRLYSSELTTEVARTRLDSMVKTKKDSVNPSQLQTFIAEYRSLATRVIDRSDGDLKAGFINCMGQSIKGFLLTLPLPSFNLAEVISHSLEFATRNNTYTVTEGAHKGKKDRTSGYNKWHSSYSGASAAAGGGASASDPMELGVISKENLPKFKNVSDTDVATRFNEGLCLYCGKGPHFVQECRSLLKDDPKHPILKIKKKEGNGKSRGEKPPSRDN